MAAVWITLTALGLALAFSGYAFYTDIKQRKIPNTLSVAGIIVFSLLFFLLHIFPPAKQASVIAFFVNAMLSFSLAIIFWYFGWWRGGDAKLAGALSLLAPLLVNKPLVFFFPSLELFLGWFLIPFAGLVLLTLYRCSFKEKQRVFARVVKQQLLRYALFLFGASWIVFSLFGFFGVGVGVGTSLFLILAYSFFSPIRAPLPILFLLAGLRIIFDWEYLSLLFLKPFGFALLLYIVLACIQQLSMTTFVTKVPLSLIETRMPLVVSLAAQQVREYFPEKRDVHYLTDADIELIKEIAPTHRITVLPIAQQFAFAPFFFIGTLVVTLFYAL